MNRTSFFSNLPVGKRTLSSKVEDNLVAQKEEWQTLNHFEGSSVCLASRRFMRSG